MKINKFLWSALIALSFVASACQKAPQAGIARGYSTYSLQEIADVAQLDCLSKIKNQMKANQITFDTSIEKQIGVDFKSISAKASSSFEQIDYSYQISNAASQITNLAVDRSSEGFATTISLDAADSDTSDWFALSIEAKLHNGNKEEWFNQKFRINSNCESILNESSHSTVTKLEKTAETTKTTLHPGTQAGSLQKQSVTFPIPENSVDAKVIENASTVSDVRKILESNKGKDFFSVFPGFGVISLRIGSNKVSQANDPNLDKIVPFETYDYKYLMDGNEMVTGSMSFSTASKTIIHIEVDSTTFSGQDEAVWSAAVFSRKEIQSSSIEADRAVFESEGLSRILLSSGSPYSYSNLKAYFEEAPAANADATSRFTNHKLLTSKKSSLPKNSAPLVAEKDQAKHQFLKETPLVEVNNPEVQKLINKLKDHKSENRVEMALRIAEIVTSTIVYDYSSLTTGQIYPLSTTDVLSRKTGVCQHFANLFAAIARGVGLPTKIIVGYAISADSPGGHAWNEIEVEPGVWIPIEPQSSKLLIPSGKYLPTTESTLLETGSYSSKEIKDYGLFRFNYKLLEKIPVQ